MVLQDTLQQQVHDAHHKVWECTLAVEEATASQNHSALDELKQTAAAAEIAALAELTAKTAQLDAALKQVEESRQAIWEVLEKI